MIEQPETAVPGIARNLEGYVGFANLPNQVYRKLVKRGFEFKLMVVGESGLGKSTLINSLFLTDLDSKDYPGPSQSIKKTVQVSLKPLDIEFMKRLHDKVNIIPLIAKADTLTPEECQLLKPLDIEFMKRLHDKVNIIPLIAKADTLTPEECQLLKPLDIEFMKRLHDKVNIIPLIAKADTLTPEECQLLKPLDIEFMKRLHDKVNIIPLIAKADTLTPEECQLFKKQIMKDIQKQQIKIYDFPDTEDDEHNKLIRRIKEKMPLAVVGINVVIEVNGKKVRGCQYPWGVAEGRLTRVHCSDEV
ncbi:septin-7-like [Pseudoliparis swirei]|uniref:septin-7-like n=1 Tax=Pseudoliparis swirei TaxID=2059687 RepID=UPI0024BE322B|nr:septin-7-like [Pseudoliparis swirei]